MDQNSKTILYESCTIICQLLYHFNKIGIEMKLLTFCAIFKTKNIWIFRMEPDQSILS